MTNIHRLLQIDGPPQAGRIGIEIEAEGVSLPAGAEGAFGHHWRVENDGSLKGPENREFVLRRPVQLADVGSVLSLLDDQYRRHRSEVHDTVRAGVHVHLNVQDMTLKQVFTFITCYFCLEQILIKYCGEGRQGNHFCLRASDAEFMVYTIAEAIEGRMLGSLSSDRMRYSAMNLCALFRYGSIEFRALRGTRNMNRIETWATILEGLRRKSLEFADPTEVVGTMSMDGGEAFARRMLGVHFATLDTGTTEEDVLTGTRHAQCIAFSTDWARFDDRDFSPFHQPNSHHRDVGIIHAPHREGEQEW